MDYEKIFESINRAIESRPLDHGAYADLFSLVRTWETADFARAHEINKQLRGKVASKLREAKRRRKRKKPEKRLEKERKRAEWLFR